MTTFTQRLNLVMTLDGMTPSERAHLLGVEDKLELGALWKVAMGNGYSDVAASIEVVSMAREEAAEWERLT